MRYKKSKRLDFRIISLMVKNDFLIKNFKRFYKNLKMKILLNYQKHVQSIFGFYKGLSFSATRRKYRKIERKGVKSDSNGKKGEAEGE